MVKFLKGIIDHVLKGNFEKMKIHSQGDYSTFTLFISFRGISSFHRITFTLRIVFILLRELQNNEQNNTDLNNKEQKSLAVCILENLDETSGVAKYTC